MREGRKESGESWGRQTVYKAGYGARSWGREARRSKDGEVFGRQNVRGEERRRALWAWRKQRGRGRGCADGGWGMEADEGWSATIPRVLLVSVCGFTNGHWVRGAGNVKHGHSVGWRGGTGALHIGARYRHLFAWCSWMGRGSDNASRQAT